MKILRILVASALGVVLMSGCVGARSGISNNSNGQLKEGRFFDPEGRFSVEVPQLLMPGARIDGSLEADGGAIGFSDDMGKLVRIDVNTARIPAAMQMVHDPDWKKTLSGFRDHLASNYRYASPRMRAVHSEFDTYKSRNIVYFSCFLPGAATISDMQTDKRLDAYRSAILFIEGDSLYSISTQRVVGLFGPKPDEKEIVESSKKELLEVLDAMAFK